MCEDCNRCWFDNTIGLYICDFWSNDDELVSVDCILDESFINGECYFAEKSNR